MNHYAHEGPDPIMFPTTLSAELPGYATGDVRIEVRADDAGGTTVATGHGAITIHPGERQTVYVRLDCGGDACIVDGGTGNADGGMPKPTSAAATGASIRTRRATPRSRRAIPAGARSRATTTSRCTRDSRAGSDCTVSCSHEPIEEVAPFDDCCPAGARTTATIPTATARRRAATGSSTRARRATRRSRRACSAPARSRPTAGRVTCAKGVLISNGTCSAVCILEAIRGLGQGPQTAAARPAPPTTRISTARQRVATGSGRWTRSATRDRTRRAGRLPDKLRRWQRMHHRLLLDQGCQAVCDHAPITAPISGDGCCPPGATNATDD